VAGAFYPGEAAALKAEVEQYLAAAADKKLADPWGVISPHAGYRFSGPVAGSAFRQLQGRPISTVVIVAFAHRGFDASGRPIHDGLATALVSGFVTPLGALPVDVEEVRALLRDAPFIADKPELFRNEHSLEVQLPFVQVALPGAKLVPLMFGMQEDPGLAKKLGALIASRYAGRPDVAVVASTDMSHYFAYDEAAVKDKKAIGLVQGLDGEGLLAAMPGREAEFCGILPVLAMMAAQKTLGGPAPALIDYRNSGDTAGDKRRVVGYGALGFLRPRAAAGEPEGRKGTTMGETVHPQDDLTPEAKTTLLDIARRSAESYVRTREKPTFAVTEPRLLEKGAAFVTLTKRGQLRGCIGHVEARAPLWECVREMAVAASTQDPRFPPVSPDELGELNYEVSVLTPMRKVARVEDIVVGRDGLMMEKGWNRGLLLPQVPGEWGWDREQFLNHTAMKAGLPVNAWRDGSVTIYSFQGIVFGDEKPEKSGQL